MKFRERILEVQGRPLTAEGIDILQVNMGYLCNMHCTHCHVSAGPRDKRQMGSETVEDIIHVLRKNEIGTLDLTGGAPELNANFRRLVRTARAVGIRVVVRTNLTVFFEHEMYDLPEFYASNSVEIIASLPCYTEVGVDTVRGRGAFRKSIEALRILNRLGYGDGSGRKKLNFVYNPSGAFLPPPQRTLEGDYRLELEKNYGIFFDSLYVFTNMPIGRFRDSLIEKGALAKYECRLENAFNALTLCGLMCRGLLSVGWDGRMYDCDFNQILGIGVDENCPQHISEFDSAPLREREIRLGEHCYGCTAGQGST